MTIASRLRLLGQAVKTSPFHGGNTGSIPVGVILPTAKRRSAWSAETRKVNIASQTRLACEFAKANSIIQLNMAPWPSGKAKVCNTSITSSNLVGA